VNDWIREQWLDKEPRLRASIRRPGASPPAGSRGNRSLRRRSPLRPDPDARRLRNDARPVLLLAHLGSRRSARPIRRHPRRQHVSLRPHLDRLAVALPARLRGEFANLEDQLLSLISNGVFNKFPDLKFVLLESGVTWLPGFIWRAVKTWRGVRAEVPWVNRSPADIIRENIRLTIQPSTPLTATRWSGSSKQIDADHMLLFASDYPHWQFEAMPSCHPVYQPIYNEKCVSRTRWKPIPA